MSEKRKEETGPFRVVKTLEEQEPKALASLPELVGETYTADQLAALSSLVQQVSRQAQDLSQAAWRASVGLFETGQGVEDVVDALSKSLEQIRGL